MSPLSSPPSPSPPPPPLPSTWEDTSWHNDACPSWHVGNEVYVYVDFEEASEREFPESQRFTVINMATDTVIIHTDVWEEVLNAVK